MAEIIWTNAAVEDLQQLNDYIGRSSPKFAESLTDKLIAQAEALKTMPMLGRVVPEFQQESLRELLVQRYRLVYRLPQPERVEIIRIIHSSLPMGRL